MSSERSDASAKRLYLIAQTRPLILCCMAVLIALSWSYLVYLSKKMPAMDMADMAMSGIKPWTVADFAMMYAMWVVMMIGMMMPSVAPIVIIFDRWNIARKKDALSHGYTAIFIFGYLLAWTIFSFFATLLQWYLNDLGLLDAMMQSNNPKLGAALLIAAGIYQLTPYKQACLKHCQNPLEFIVKFWRPGKVGSFRTGLFHGFFCIGCCWLVMALLFFFGVMNLFWIAMISLYVLLEKLFTVNRLWTYGMSAIAVFSGIFLLF